MSSYEKIVGLHFLVIFRSLAYQSSKDLFLRWLRRRCNHMLVTNLWFGALNSCDKLNQNHMSCYIKTMLGKLIPMNYLRLYDFVYIELAVS